MIHFKSLKNNLFALRQKCSFVGFSASRIVINYIISLFFYRLFYFFLSIIFSLFFYKCKSVKYSEKQKENIRKIDSISRSEKEMLILDFKENH